MDHDASTFYYATHASQWPYIESRRYMTIYMTTVLLRLDDVQHPPYACDCSEPTADTDLSRTVKQLHN